MSQTVASAIVLGVLLATILILQRPLVAGRGDAAVEADELLRADLEAGKVAKYREIRDAELDRRTGKLSDADWRDADRRLREEAVELLRQLDELGPAGDPARPADEAARASAEQAALEDPAGARDEGARTREPRPSWEA